MTLEEIMDECFLPNWKEEIKKDTELATELRLYQTIIQKVISICKQEIEDAKRQAKIDECKYWQDAIFSPQSIIAQLSVIDFQLRITELNNPLPESSISNN